MNPGTKRSNLNVRWDKKSRAFVVDNLFSIECEELDDLVAVLEEGAPYKDDVQLIQIGKFDHSFFFKVSKTAPSAPTT